MEAAPDFAESVSLNPVKHSVGVPMTGWDRSGGVRQRGDPWLKGW